MAKTYSTIPRIVNKNEREMTKASFILMDCKRYIKQPVTRMMILVKPTLNGLNEDNKNPNNKLITNRMAVIINDNFFIVGYIWGGSGGRGGGQEETRAGTFLMAVQLDIPVVQTSVSSFMVPCAFIWLI